MFTNKSALYKLYNKMIHCTYFSNFSGSCTVYWIMY